MTLYFMIFGGLIGSRVGKMGGLDYMAFIVPGLGLGVSVCRASRVTDGMIGAAAQALASLVRISRPGQSILPALNDLRRVSATVAIAVAKAAEAEGVAGEPLTDPVQEVFDAMWQPVYPELVLED